MPLDFHKKQKRGRRTLSVRKPLSIANCFYEIVFVRLILHLALHCAEADDHGPQVSAGFWNHQGAHYRDCFGEENYREVAAEAQHDGEPHPAEGAVVLRFGAAEVEHDDQQAQQGERDVPINSPGQRRIGNGPPVLRHHAQGDSNSGQQVYRDGQIFVAGDVVAFAPYVVDQHVENRHGDGCHPFADSQWNYVVSETGGAQGDDTWHQMEGIAGTQDYSHPSEKGILAGLAPASADHFNSNGDNGYEIGHVKNWLHNCLHSMTLLFYFFAARTAAPLVEHCSFYLPKESPTHVGDWVVGMGSVWVAAGANAALYEPSAANISCAAALPVPVPDRNPHGAVPPASGRTERCRKPPA